MKSTGVVRKVDELGRIVLPIEIRKVLDINVKDPVEIFTDLNSLIGKSIWKAQCWVPFEILGTWYIFLGIDTIVPDETVISLSSIRKEQSSPKKKCISA